MDLIPRIEVLIFHLLYSQIVFLTIIYGWDYFNVKFIIKLFRANSFSLSIDFISESVNGVY